MCSSFAAEALACVAILALATADRVRRPGLDMGVGFGLDVEGFTLDAGFGFGFGFGATLAFTGLVGTMAGVLGFVDLVGRMNVLSSGMFSSITGPSIGVRSWLLMH